MSELRAKPNRGRKTLENSKLSLIPEIEWGGNLERGLCKPPKFVRKCMLETVQSGVYLKLKSISSQWRIQDFAEDGRKPYFDPSKIQPCIRECWNIRRFQEFLLGGPNQVPQIEKMKVTPESMMLSSYELMTKPEPRAKLETTRDRSLGMELSELLQKFVEKSNL